MIFPRTFTAAFFLLIIITGVLTSITDLRHKKIGNNHLMIIAMAAVILTIAKALSDKSLPMLQLFSTGCAIIVAVVFYKNDFWRGGDAKLFVLLSFLMPATGYESKIFLPCIALFANAFTVGLISISPLLAKDFFTNRKLITENILKAGMLSNIFKAMLQMLCVSWIIFPLLYVCGLMKYGFFSFLSIYLINISFREQIGKRLMYNKIFAVTVFACGLFLRYKFSPGFFSWQNFLSYLSTVIVYTLFSLILFRETKYIVKSNERIPFAPLLFLGCLLSYTPFLWRIMSLLHSGR